MFSVVQTTWQRWDDQSGGNWSPEWQEKSDESSADLADVELNISSSDL